MSPIIVEINRVTNRNDEDIIRLKLKDRMNYNLIIEVEIDLATFTKILTNQGGLSGKLKYFMDQETFDHIYHDRKIKDEYCDKVGYNKEEQRQEVLKDFHSKYLTPEWQIKDDGTSSQQHGKKHRYTIFRYIDVNG